MSAGSVSGTATLLVVASVTFSGVLCEDFGFDLDGGSNFTTTSHNGSATRYEIVAFNWAHVSTPFTLTLWLLLAAVAKIGFNLSKKLVSMFPDSSLLIIVGLLVGSLLYFAHTSQETFFLSSEIFFLFLLPPIVFDAGYFMPNRAFFDNLGTILVYAVIGTIWNASTIGLSLYAISLTGLFSVDTPLLHLLLFSSLISAVDPIAVLVVFEEVRVNQILYITVFGESLLNDAVTVVLYNVFSAFAGIGSSNILPVDIISGFVSFFVVGLGGVAVGLVWSVITSFTTRYTQHVQVLEPLIIFSMAYASYLTAEMVHLSGILAIVFCGITMKQYIRGNVSQNSQTTVMYALKMLSSSCETVIFMFLGLSTVSTEHMWDTAFVSLTIFFCLVYRTIGVVIQTFFINKLRLTKLNTIDQFILAYGGLRGAIAYGLVIALNEQLIPAKKVFVTTTIVVIYFTVFFQGITIKPLVEFLKVKRQEQRQKSMHEKVTEKLLDHVSSGIDNICGFHGHHWVRDRYDYYNLKYMKPFLMRKAIASADLSLVEMYQKLNMQEAMQRLKESGSDLSPRQFQSLSALMISHFEQQQGRRVTGDSMLATTPILDMNIFDFSLGRRLQMDAQTHHASEDPRYYYQHQRSLAADSLTTNHEPDHRLVRFPMLKKYFTKKKSSATEESKKLKMQKTVAFSESTKMNEPEKAPVELTLIEKQLPWAVSEDLPSDAAEVYEPESRRRLHLVGLRQRPGEDSTAEGQRDYHTAATVAPTEREEPLHGPRIIIETLPEEEASPTDTTVPVADQQQTSDKPSSTGRV